MLIEDKVTIFENEKITVWAYPQQGIIHHQIHQYVSGTPFRQALEKGVEAMITYGSCGWLSDDRSNGALHPSDLEWAELSWFPKAVSAGWRFWALLPPRQVIGQMNIRRHIQLYKARGITVEIFPEDLDAALKWLESRPK
jgi:hypothetical protein